MTHPQEIPEGISKEMWEAATRSAELLNDDYAIGALSVAPVAEAIARAIIAATLAEREACLRLASAVPIGNLHQTNETDLKRLWKLAGSAQAGAIAAAIRQRSEA